MDSRKAKKRDRNERRKGSKKTTPKLSSLLTLQRFLSFFPVLSNPQSSDHIGNEKGTRWYRKRRGDELLLD